MSLNICKRSGENRFNAFSDSCKTSLRPLTRQNDVRCLCIRYKINLPHVQLFCGKTILKYFARVFPIANIFYSMVFFRAIYHFRNLRLWYASYINSVESNVTRCRNLERTMKNDQIFCHKNWDAANHNTHRAAEHGHYRDALPSMAAARFFFFLLSKPTFFKNGPV